MYGRKSYDIESLLFDPHPGKAWYLEPHLEALLHVEEIVIVKGSFRHRDCKRVLLSGRPFTGFTCSMCSNIVSEIDFRLHIV